MKNRVIGSSGDRVECGGVSRAGGARCFASSSMATLPLRSVFAWITPVAAGFDSPARMRNWSAKTAAVNISTQSGRREDDGDAPARRAEC